MKRLLRLLATFLLILFSPAAYGQGTPAAPATPPASPAAAPAATPETPAAAAPAKPKGLTLQDMIAQGGKTIYVLLALSGIMIAMVVFYILSIRRGAVVSDQFMRTADSLIRNQDYIGLLAVCNRRNESIARITQRALDFATKNPTATFDEVREVTESEGQRQATQLSQRITYLADIGAVAPMIGLFGTVVGIIQEFASIAEKSATQAMSAQMEFSGGTAHALINTAAGLVIAIPAMIIYSLYRGKVNTLISELEAASTHIMALLSAQYKRVTAARAQQAAAGAASRQQAR